MIKLGLDFDNTLISYDEIFYKVALERNLISENCPHEKKIIRDLLIKQNKEKQFTLLQGEVYGNRILEARPADGVIKALLNLKNAINVDLYIISHKTKFPIKGPKYDLHDAAMRWLDRNGFFDFSGPNLKKENVYMEENKINKINRIDQLCCTHYIDDLPEILEMINSKCIKIFYNPFNYLHKDKNWVNLNKWKDLDKIFS